MTDVQTCCCGHSRSDHDMWGNGSCLELAPCPCEAFAVGPVKATRWEAMICERCTGTGHTGDTGERYCSCPAGYALRERIEVSPEFAEFRRKRAQVDHMLARIEESALPVLLTQPVVQGVADLGTPLGTRAAEPDDPSCN